MSVHERGWLGHMDAAILDWTRNKDLPRDKPRDLPIAAFGPHSSPRNKPAPRSPADPQPKVDAASDETAPSPGTSR
jgi:hypothetical protein